MIRETSAESHSEAIPFGKWGVALGIFILGLAGYVTWLAAKDSKNLSALESLEIPRLQDDKAAYYTPDSPLISGKTVVQFAGNAMILASDQEIHYPEEEVLLMGLDDSRVQGIYELKKPMKESEQYRLLRTGTDTYLRITEKKK